MLTPADGYDPAKPEQFDWLMVGPPELSVAALEVAAEVRLLLASGETNEFRTVRGAVRGLRLALRLIARHARRE